MPVVVMLRWEGVTPEQYEEARKLINWEGDVPAGGLFHVAAFDQSGARVTDVWDSAEDFQRFVDDRLMPGVQQIGIQGQPQVEILPAHAVFAPGYER
jgi:hypothetical protein